MNKEFIPYEQALELKELGLLTYKKDNDFGLLYKGSDIPSILYQQAFRWFREKHDLFGCIDLQACVPSHWFIRIDKIEINDYLYHSEDENIQYSTYEEAELACLKRLIETLQARDKVGKWFADNADITIEMNKNERK
jgi:hypothetical protein